MPPNSNVKPTDWIYVGDATGSDGTIGDLQSWNVEDIAEEIVDQPLDSALVVSGFGDDHSGGSGPDSQGLSKLKAEISRTWSPVPDRHVVIMRLDFVEAARLRNEVDQERGMLGIAYSFRRLKLSA